MSSVPMVNRTRDLVLVDPDGSLDGRPRARASSLSIVIPALNEENGIDAILQRILAQRDGLADVGISDLEVIVVDDGSKDRTAERIRTYPDVRLIQHEVNRGYGAALKTGFNAATGDLLAF
ncbi:MAG: glycosyltransferase family 2 protein, partial [Chloroflexota bacterium]